MIRGLGNQVWPLAVWAGLAGCASIGAVQTADTVGRGNVQFGIEMGIQGMPPRDGETGLAWPHFDASIRYGVHERIDIGARLGQSVLELNTKVLVTRPDHPLVALSVAPAAGGLLMFDSRVNSRFPALSAAVPVLLGFKLGGNELVLGARGQYLMAVPDRVVHALGVGGSLGAALRVSPNFLVFPELSLTLPVLGRLPVESPRFVRAQSNGLLLQLTIGLLIGHTRTSHPEGDPHRP